MNVQMKNSLAGVEPLNMVALRQVQMRRNMMSLVEAEVFAALGRYYKTDRDSCEQLIKDRRCELQTLPDAEGIPGFSFITDSITGDEICSWTRVELMPESNMNFNFFPQYEMKMQFRFKAFDNKTTRDSINDSTKPKGKRKK